MEVFQIAPKIHLRERSSTRNWLNNTNNEEVGSKDKCVIEGNHNLKSLALSDD